MDKKIVIILVARMGSKRFPGKTLEKIGKYTLLEYTIKRLRLSKLANDLCLATTNKDKDNPVAETAKNSGVKVFRGSEEDVLGRFYQASVFMKADIIVEVTGDCPLIDASLIDKGVEIFLKSKHDCVGIGMNKNYPHGLDFYVLGKGLLSEMNEKAKTPVEREHIIEYVTSRPKDFNCYYMEAPVELKRPDVRITVDYPQDLKIVKEIVDSINMKAGAERFNYSAGEIIKEWDKIHAKSK
ncbi:MAG: hypothetical protein HQL27_02640 [Candidatus Omnitrophica bacterium]|nr:hypothetical protein [Candidatus Omnitrophota bacterium]